MPDKQVIYRYIRVGGLLSSIPFVLVSGPLAGYLAAEFLKEKFHLNALAALALIALGFICSFIETIRIIRNLLKHD